MPRFPFRSLAAALLLSLLAICAESQTAPIPQSQLSSVQAPQPRVTSYTLSPNLLQESYALYLTSVWLFFATTIYGFALAILYLRRRWIARFRDFAARLSGRRVVQALIVIPLFALTVSLFLLPFEIYGQHVERHYGLSVQTWPSWLRDWFIALALTLLAATVLSYILYAIIRRSPRRWWLWFWLAFLPISAFVTFIEPVAIDPLFDKYEPLANKRSALVAELQKVAQRGGLNIPASRMFEMKASEKLTGSNAYVTGFGATKRIVVWDTAIQKMTKEQIAFVFGHEMGHYVLGHIVQGFVFMAAVSLLLLYLTYCLANWMLCRWGAQWDIPGLDDWASLPLFWLVISVLLFLSGPGLNAFSRHLEHQADQYGLEVVHGLIPDSSQVAAQSFQKLGEEWLEYPYLSKFAVWWAWDHPPIPDRIRFALTYDPWSA
ncbi:MAG TPA: M48 family metallopeptidase, partial [Terriglobales bacterium]|nr:M48 family metallopeptidase [Terriglobales bacterium]